MGVTVEDVLEHHGIKGMRWGVRKDRTPTGFRLQTSAVEIDPALNPSTQAAAKRVSSLINDRYGFQTTAIRNLKTANPEEYRRGTVGYVTLTKGKREGIVYITPDDVQKKLKDAEGVKWFGEGTGNVTSMLTHESAHAMFHALGPTASARKKALKAAVKQAKSDGVEQTAFLSHISGYALASGTREEAEAEMFSQYHWGTNPPAFVKVWGETLNQGMGVDPTPFREVVKHG